MIERQAFAVIQGDTWNWSFVYLEPDEVTPVNLTGYTAKLQLRATGNSPASETLSSTTGEITLEPLTGRVSVALSANRTAALSGIYLFDVQLETVTSTKTVILGRLEVIEQVTI
jgi:hypothetical protein